MAYYVSSGQVSSGIILTNNSMYVSSGGTADSTTVNSGGRLDVYSGGTATNVTINYGSGLFLSGGYGASVTARNGATIVVGVNGVLSNVSITGNNGRAAGDILVSSGGKVYSATVGLYGDFYLFGTAEANHTVVNSGGILYCGFNDDWGYVYPYYGSRGGIAYDTTLESGGSMRLYVSGSANNVLVNSGAALTLSGGSVYKATVNSGGSMAVFSGGTANSTTINSSGYLFVSSGGTANDTTVNGGFLTIYNGGKVTGTLQIATGTTVSAYSGSIIDFDISSRTVTSPALINNLSLINGLPKYTVTVSSTQADGTYKLAENAGGFNSTITLTIENDSYENVLTVGYGYSVNDRTYSLGRDSSNTLTLIIAEAPTPSASGVAGDLNGDGRADIVMTIAQNGHGAYGATGAWLIQADQTAAWGDLTTRNSLWTVFGMGFTTAGKNTADVYAKSIDNVIGAWTTGDDGKVNGWETVGQFDNDTQIVGLGDFNGNGQTDLLLRNVNGAVGCFFTSGEQTGWNYFQSLGDEWQLSAIGDLNGDGRDDVVLKHDAGFAGSWLTQEDGTMAWADLDTLSDGFVIVGAGDFDGDGTDDVLLKSGNYYGAWQVYNGNARAWMGLGDLGDVTVEQIADFNGDGKDDLRIRTSAGDIGTMLVNGADDLSWKYYGSVGSEWSTGLAALA